MASILWRETWALWQFGLLKVPMIFWVKPTVLALTDEQVTLKIPLKRRTKNHLNSMYFGALCVGADVAGGIHMLHFMKSSLNRFSFVFKDFQAEFLKRPEADVHFTSMNGLLIRQTMNKALQSQSRENALIEVIATTPSLSDEEVARFKLTLSIKQK
ncbi:MAG: DUF4442 domain-containing protein [Gammaproteobacteria bacterium]